MSTFRNSLAGLLLSVVMAGPCQAYMLKNVGYGIKQCSEFWEAERLDSIGKQMTIVSPKGITYYTERWQYVQWARGYIVGMNAAHLDHQYSHDDGDYVEISLIMYCKAHPTEPFSNAVMDFMGSQGFPTGR